MLAALVVACGVPALVFFGLAPADYKVAFARKEKHPNTHPEGSLEPNDEGGDRPARA